MHMYIGNVFTQLCTHTHVLLHHSSSFLRQHPPILTYTCSSTLLETTVQSPVDVIFNESQLDRSSQLNHSTSETSSDDEELGRLTRSALDSSQQGPSSSTSKRLFQSERERSYQVDENHSLSASHGGSFQSHSLAANAATATTDGYTLAREKLHSLLESYKRSQGEREHRELPKSPYRVKFKPPVPRFRREQAFAASGRRGDGGEGVDDNILPSSRPTTPSYRSLTVGIGPHKWQNCPRRSPKRRRSRSLPCSRAPWAKCSKQADPSPLHRQRATTVPNQIPLDRLEAVHLDCGHPDLAPRSYQPLSGPALRPPFTVGRPDPKLMSKRNFCGEIGVTAVRHVTLSSPNPTTLRTLTFTGAGRRSLTPPRPAAAATMATASGMPPFWREDSADELSDGSDSDSDGDNDSSGPSPSPVRHARSNLTTPLSNKPQSSRGAPSSSFSSRKYGLVSTRSPLRSGKRYCGRKELISKYLVERSAGRRKAGEGSPSKVIVDKIQRLRDECCACLVSMASNKLRMLYVFVVPGSVRYGVCVLNIVWFGRK